MDEGGRGWSAGVRGVLGVPVGTGRGYGSGAGGMARRSHKPLQGSPVDKVGDLRLHPRLQALPKESSDSLSPTAETLQKGRLRQCTPRTTATATSAGSARAEQVHRR